MMTPIASITRFAKQTRTLSVPLLVAGALAAGCGTVHASASDPGSVGKSTAATSTAAPTTSPSPTKAAPVPTVSGGPVIAGDTACAGWPSDAPRAKLTAFFQPVAVERCVTGFQVIQGKGEWETATLEKSTDNLAALVEVLLQPSARVQPGVFCPEFAVIPPQVLLISSTGKKLIPLLPTGACGIADARVLTTLAAMTWQPISVRLISKISSAGTPRTLPGASIGPGSPKVLRTGAPVAAS
ncbi:MAG: hypothetical protein ABSA02_19630 [Trebonia sp.]|jgi:hypothetical protein